MTDCICIITLGQHYMYKWHLHYLYICRTNMPHMTINNTILCFIKFSQIHLCTKHGMLIVGLFLQSLKKYSQSMQRSDQMH